MALLILAALQMLPRRHLRGGEDRRHPSGHGVLPGHPAADQAGAAGRGDLPRSRRAARLRPHLRADRRTRSDTTSMSVYRAPAARRLPGGRPTARPRRRCSSSSSRCSVIIYTGSAGACDSAEERAMKDPRHASASGSSWSSSSSSRSSRSTTRSSLASGPARALSRSAYWPDAVRPLELRRRLRAPALRPQHPELGPRRRLRRRPLARSSASRPPMRSARIALPRPHAAAADHPRGLDVPAGRGARRHVRADPLLRPLQHAARA